MKNVIIVLLIVVLGVVLISCGESTDNLTSTTEDVSMTVSAPKLALLVAVYQNKIDIVQQHMDAGTNPNEYSRPIGMVLVHLDTVGANGAYPLHLAVVEGNKEIVQILIDNGAEIDIKAQNFADDFWYNAGTPLHWAAFFCRKDIVSLLIELGAPVNALDDVGDTPMDALFLGEEVVEMRSSDDIGDGSGYARNFPLWAGCHGKLKDESAEQKLLEDIIAIIEENGGKSGKEL
jgi:ankyrin repeat protein